MKKETIKVLIVDDVSAIRENIGKLLEFHPEIQVVGQAGSASEAIEKAGEIQPDVILMDINMPGMDGIAATEVLAVEAPQSSIIIMSVQGEQEYLRRAMLAGAKNYLVKPFTGDELLQAVKQVHANAQKRGKVVKLDPKAAELGKIITIFSTKGGIGKTTIASNMAVALAAKTGARVGVIDADLQFGDVALFLNIVPQATIADLVCDMEDLDAGRLESYLTPFNDKVKLLSAPLRPEQAETVSGAHMTAILKIMRTMFDYIIIDTAPSFNDAMLAVLDAADQVLVIAAMDLPTIKNVKLGLEIMESLDYSRDKIKVVLNRANSEGGMRPREVEESLRYSFAATLPSDGRTVVCSVNRGIPFVLSNPDTGVSQGIFELVKIIAGGAWKAQEPNRGVVSQFKRLFG